MTIWLDVTTTRGWGRPALGIVRVEAETARQFLAANDPAVRFCRFDLEYRSYFEVGREELTFALARLDAGGDRPAAPSSAPSPSPAVAAAMPTPAQRWKRRALGAVSWLPQPVRGPLLRFGATRKEGLRGVLQSVREARRAAPLLWRGSPAPTVQPAPAPLVKPDILFGQGDVVVSLGLDWDQKDLPYLRELKERLELKVLLMCYDIIPVRLPHLCVPDVAAKFSGYFLDVAACADRILCISDYSRRDLRRYLEAEGAPMPALGLVPLGCEIAAAADAAASAAVAEVLGQRFILFVSTIERRKNHETLYRAYTRMIDAGVAGLPLLVFVGMAGWGMSDLMADLRLDPRIRPYLRILQHVSDADLARLYQQTLFTVYPSLYEGWGLPVAESLAYGKFCLASNAASIPEVAGDLVDYVDPWDVPRWAERLRWYIEHPQEVALREDAIRAGYRCTTWQETGAAIVAAAAALQHGQACGI